jgi:hypothetical protein
MITNFSKRVAIENEVRFYLANIVKDSRAAMDLSSFDTLLEVTMSALDAGQILHITVRPELPAARRLLFQFHTPRPSA